MFKSSAVAGSVFKARPSRAWLSPEGPPASWAGLVWGQCENPQSSGGHHVEPEQNCQHVQDGVGHLEACPLVGRDDPAVLGSAHQEGRVDVVP